MKAIADFRRATTVGSRWRCVNHLYPSVSGDRLVTKQLTRSICYEATKTDGSIVTGWLDYPKADAVSFDGDSIRFLVEPGGERVAFTWTLVSPK